MLLHCMSIKPVEKMSACKSPSSESAYVCTKYFLLAPYKLQRFLYVDEWDLISIIQVVQFGFYQRKCWGLTASGMIPF